MQRGTLMSSIDLRRDARRALLHWSRSGALNDHSTDSGQQSMMPAHEILQTSFALRLH
jgi:hypothetical protein